MGYEFFGEKIIVPSAPVPGINNDQSLNYYFSFRIKQELLIVYSYEFICVYIVSFYANITPIRTRSYH